MARTQPPHDNNTPAALEKRLHALRRSLEHHPDRFGGISMTEAALGHNQTRSLGPHRLSESLSILELYRQINDLDARLHPKTTGRRPNVH